MLIWLKFNIYSMLLAFLAALFLIGIIVFPYLHNIFLFIPILLCSIYMISKSIEIFRKYRYKKNISDRLIQKAQKRFDQRYFIPYMGSPCMRSVVYFSLCEINRRNEYSSIKKIAMEESGVFSSPRVVNIQKDEKGKWIFIARNPITGEIEKI